MPSRKKSSKLKPDVEIVKDTGLDSLWAEIDKAVGAYESPQPGDITRQMLADHHHISTQSTHDRMKRLEATGDWRIVMVKAGNGDRPHMVLRKVVK